MDHLHRDAVHVLRSWHPPDATQDELRAAYLEFLEVHRDGVSRECRVGHLTASALVVNPTRDAVLLTLHPKVGRWLQLGGHIEAVDASIQAAAIREAREESGHPPRSISAQPVRLDRHAVSCGGGQSWHLDVQYIVTIAADVIPQVSHESLDLRWFPIGDVPGDPSVQALIADARAGRDAQVSIP